MNSADPSQGQHRGRGGLLRPLLALAAGAGVTLAAAYFLSRFRENKARRDRIRQLKATLAEKGSRGA